jgi:hypothetical protein
VLLRYSLLFGVPISDDDWAKFKAWRSVQMAAPMCDAGEVDAPAGHTCEGCTRTDCAKKRKASYEGA